MYMQRNKGMAVPLGLLCLGIANLLGRLGTDAFPYIGFFEGLLVGMSCAFAAFGLIANAVMIGNE